MLSKVLVIIIYVFIGFHQSDATVTLNYNEDYIVFGHDVTVTCKVEGETFQHWKDVTRNNVLSEGTNYGGKVTVTTTSVSSTVTEIKLSFENVDETVAGNFSCVGNQNIQYYFLYIEVTFDYNTCKEEQGLVFATNDEIECLVHAFPTPTLTWSKKVNGVYEIINDSRFSTQPGGALRVQNVREEDAGEYQLTGEIRRRSGQDDFKIKIYHPAEIDRVATPGKIYSYVGNQNPIKLTCNASGIPKPNIKLEKDNSSVNYFSIDIPGYYSVEFLTNNRGMFGAYKWTASNAVNDDVYGVELIEAVKPQLVHIDREIIGYRNEETTVHCKLTGKPYPFVIWYRNGEQLNDSEKYEILNNEGQEGDLIISNTAESDIGEYVCYATNMMGNTTGKPYITSVVDRLVETGKRSSDGGMVIGIIIAVILILIICLDLFCCFFNNCGICHCCYLTFCSKNNTSSTVPEQKEKKDDIAVDEALLKKKTGEKLSPEENV